MGSIDGRCPQDTWQTAKASFNNGLIQICLPTSGIITSVTYRTCCSSGSLKYLRLRVFCLNKSRILFVQSKQQFPSLLFCCCELLVRRGFTWTTLLWRYKSSLTMSFIKFTAILCSGSSFEIDFLRYLATAVITHLMAPTVLSLAMDLIAGQSSSCFHL